MTLERNAVFSRRARSVSTESRAARAASRRRAKASEGALQVLGNISITDGAVLTDQVVDGEITIPAGKNGLIIGPAAVSLGSTIIVETGSTLVIV